MCCIVRAHCNATLPPYMRTVLLIACLNIVLPRCSWCAAQSDATDVMSVRRSFGDVGLCGGSCPIVFEKAAVARPAQGQERAARPASEAYISERSPKPSVSLAWWNWI